MAIILTWSTTLIMKKVNSVDNATNQKIIFLLLKYPTNVMILLNTVSASSCHQNGSLVWYEVKIVSNVKGYYM